MTICCYVHVSEKVYQLYVYITMFRVVCILEDRRGTVSIAKKFCSVKNCSLVIRFGLTVSLLRTLGNFFLRLLFQCVGFLVAWVQYLKERDSSTINCRKRCSSIFKLASSQFLRANLVFADIIKLETPTYKCLSQMKNNLKCITVFL